MWFAVALVEGSIVGIPVGWEAGCIVNNPNVWFAVALVVGFIVGIPVGWAVGFTKSTPVLFSLHRIQHSVQHGHSISSQSAERVAMLSPEGQSSTGIAPVS